MKCDEFVGAYNEIWASGHLSVAREGSARLLAMCNPEVDWYEPPLVLNPGFVLPELGLIHNVLPFAGNGAGDWWSHVDRSPNCCVALLWHDAQVGTAYAEDLSGFIFRQTLEALSRFEIRGETKPPRSRRVQLDGLRSGALDAAEQLPERMKTFLRQVLKRDPDFFEEPRDGSPGGVDAYVAFINPEEVQAALQQYPFWSKELDEDFRYR